jgi:hypothetical protein
MFLSDAEFPKATDENIITLFSVLGRTSAITSGYGQATGIC